MVGGAHFAARSSVSPVRLPGLICSETPQQILVCKNSKPVSDSKSECAHTETKNLFSLTERALQFVFVG